MSVQLNSCKPIYIDVTAFLFRICLGSFMLIGHGWGKLQLLLKGGEVPDLFAMFGMSARMGLIMAVGAEVFCSVLVIIGLKMRWALIPLIFTMLTAGFYFHAADVFFERWAPGEGNKEFALLYALGFATLFGIGAGRYSLDAILYKK